MLISRILDEKRGVMVHLSEIRHDLTPVSNVSENLRLRIKFALNGAERNHEKCFSNPFTLDAHTVTDIDRKDYDLREVLHYLNTGFNYTVEGQDVYLIPCPKGRNCVNPHHTLVFKPAHVSKNRFFKKDNQNLLEEVHPHFSNRYICWHTILKMDANKRAVLRQLVAVAFGVFDSSQVGHLLDDESKYGFVRTRKGKKKWFACAPTCVNPYHAPLPPTALGITEPLRGEAYRQFRNYLHKDLLASKSYLVCPVVKVTYSTEEKANLARSKWVELKLNQNRHAPRVYRCHVCAYWHLTTKKLVKEWIPKRKPARPLAEGELFARK